MPTFNYIATDSSGRKIKGKMEARDQAFLVSELRRKSMLVLKVELAKEKEELHLIPRKKVKLDDLAVFSRQLNTLIKSGVTLVKSLSILGEQTENRELKKVISSVRTSVEAGYSLSDSLSRHPQAFSSFYINMVRAGESSGALEDILERLSTYLEKTTALLRRVRTAMIYPVAVVIIAFSISSFLFLRVIPGFKQIFETLGGSLPLPTRIVIGVSDVLRHAFFYLLAILILIFWWLGGYIRQPKGRLKFDQFKLRVFLFGKLFQKLAIARFSRTLATLIKSGVPILTSLDIISRTVGNRVLELAITKSKEEVGKGEKIAPTLLQHKKLFPPLVVNMIAVGEESGELAGMLDKIAESYESELEVTVNALTGMIEPFIIIFLGGIIGLIVFAMFLPILKITQLLGGMR